jgi:Amt family ammonium transporter
MIRPALTLRGRVAAVFAALGCAVPSLHAADGPVHNSGDTAWLLTSTALVLFMMIPGLALFYAGLVRSKNVLSIFMQCFALTAVLSLVWLVCGYSLSFTGDSGFIGTMSKAFLKGVEPASSYAGCAPSNTGYSNIPEHLWFVYQMMFFLITPGLFIGAFAERMKFSAIMVFSVLWSLLVYVPTCYGVWHRMDFFGLKNVIDLAGGIVVHITAGVAALVACVMVGRRQGFPHTQMMPHNLPYTIVGAGMLWVGWFGFNGGSQVAANGSAALTVVVTHLSACAACVVWSVIEKIKLGKPSALGIATGSIAGLAAITPASGKVGPLGAVCIGSISAFVCWIACAKLKKKFNYDDSLDVFGVHGVGGFVGTVLVAIFASKDLGGQGYNAPEITMGAQLTTQLLAALYTIILSGVVSYVLLKIIDKTIGLRVSSDDERQGLDLAEHGESGYNS